MIIGIASVAILGAYTMSIGGSGRQKTLSQLNVLLHNVAESVTYQVQLQPQALAASPPSQPLYVSCATVGGTITSPSVNIVNGALNYAGSTLITGDFAMPAQTSVTLSSIQYWDYANDGWSDTCPLPSASVLAADPPQLITANATGPSGISETISFVVISPT